MTDAIELELGPCGICTLCDSWGQACTGDAGRPQGVHVGRGCSAAHADTY